MTGINSIPEAIEAIKAGEIIIVVDDEDRENEGDLIMSAEAVTPEAINFMALNGRGMICLPATGERLEELGLDMMVDRNTSKMGTPFTISIDVLQGTTTGISAHDRARTIKEFINPEARESDFGRPGHIFPLKARSGGVLVRAGHTEAVVDLARMAGHYPAGVLCEIMAADGTMARLPELKRLADRFNLKLVTIKDLIEFRQQNEKLVEKVVETSLPIRQGDYRLYLYRSTINRVNHVALVKGDLTSEKPPLVRVHSSCLTGDVFHSRRCDCGDQMEAALDRIEAEGHGIFLYMNQEGRGIGLENKIRAYMLQEEGLDTVEANEKLGFDADLREYGIGAQILVDLGVSRLRLLTNNPRKLVGLEGYGLEIVERIAIEVEANEINRRYLRTKRDKLGHILEVGG